MNGKVNNEKGEPAICAFSVPPIALGPVVSALKFWLGVTPATVASIVVVTGERPVNVVGSVQVALATPVASVVEGEVVKLLVPPLTDVQVTVASLTGLLYLSFTITDGLAELD